MKNKKLKNQIFFARQFLLKKNRKGFLLAEETLKIILAVISIGFLVYFLSALYFANQDSEELEQAEASLKKISEIVDSDEDGVVEAINPEGWYLFDFTENEKPNSCVGKSCLCICDKVLIDDILFGLISGRQANECNENGACLVVLELEKFDEIEIKNPKEGLTGILIKKQNNKILISEEK